MTRRLPLLLLVLLAFGLGGCRFTMRLGYTIVALYGGEVVITSQVNVTDMGDLGKRLAADMRDDGYREIRTTRGGELVTVRGFRLLDDLAAGLPGGAGMLGGERRLQSRLQTVGDAVDLVVSFLAPLDTKKLEAEAGGAARELLDVGFDFTIVLPGKLLETNAPRSEALVVEGTPYTRLWYSYQLFRDAQVDIRATTRVYGEVPTP